MFHPLGWALNWEISILEAEAQKTLDVDQILSELEQRVWDLRTLLVVFQLCSVSQFLPRVSRILS